MNNFREWVRKKYIEEISHIIDEDVVETGTPRHSKIRAFLAVIEKEENAHLNGYLKFVSPYEDETLEPLLKRFKSDLKLVDSLKEMEKDAIFMEALSS